MRKREYINLFLLFLLLIGYQSDIVIEASIFSLDTEYEQIYLPKEEETIPSLELLAENIVEIPTENVVNMRSTESGRWIWPTVDYYPVICDYLCYNNHYAIDIYGPVGTPLYAGRDGVVVQITSSCPSMSANKKECGGGIW